MHKLGIGLIVLTAALALGAIVLTAKTFDVRNSWARRVEQLESDVRSSEQQIREKETQLQQLQTEYEQVMLGWDRYWNNVQTVPGPAPGQLTTNSLGLTQGLRPLNPPQQGQPPTPPEIHVFRTGPDGASTYLGPFKAVQIVENQAVLEANWRARGSEAEQWMQNHPPGPLRHRALIPAGFKEAYEPLHRTLALADENYLAKQRHLATMTDLDQRAVEQLQFRRSEVQDAVTELQNAEEVRSVELVELDRLRRELQDAHNQMEQLIADARRLEQLLPQPTSQVVSE
jgi:hypothetical protein